MEQRVLCDGADILELADADSRLRRVRHATRAARAQVRTRPASPGTTGRISRVAAPDVHMHHVLKLSFDVEAHANELRNVVQHRGEPLVLGRARADLAELPNVHLDWLSRAIACGA